MRLVLASNNAKKLAELLVLLEGVAVSLVTQDALGISEAEEPHLSFLENALAKARHAAAASGAAALADDSGLCVDALGGEPGVNSAGYAVLAGSKAGERETRRRAQDLANNQHLLQALQGVADRRACFVSALVAVRHAADPQPLVAMGRWAGEILRQPQGEGGFGYDPLMFIPSLGRSVAQLDAGQKNQVSHRAVAMQQMRVLLREVWRL